MCPSHRCLRLFLPCFCRVPVLLASHERHHASSLTILCVLIRLFLSSGVLGGYLGGASVVKGALRVVIGGWLALGISYGIGAAFNVGPA